MFTLKLPISEGKKTLDLINVREYRRGNTNVQSRETDKTKKNKTKTQHNMC